AGATLKISDPVTVNAGKNLAQVGAGTVAYESTVKLGAGAGISFGSSSSVETLAMTSGATAELTSGGNKVLTVNSLSIDNTAQLNVRDNALIARGGNYSDIEAKVLQGFNGGNWLGKGITSSTAASDTSGSTALGIVDNGGDILVKYTFAGDSDLT